MDENRKIECCHLFQSRTQRAPYIVHIAFLFEGLCVCMCILSRNNNSKQQFSASAVNQFDKRVHFNNTHLLCIESHNLK